MPQILVLKTAFEGVRTIDFCQVLGKLAGIADPVARKKGHGADSREPADVQSRQAPVGRKLRDSVDAVLGGDSHRVAERLKLRGVNPAVAEAQLVDQGRRKGVRLAQRRIKPHVFEVAGIEGASIRSTRKRTRYEIRSVVVTDTAKHLVFVAAVVVNADVEVTGVVLVNPLGRAVVADPCRGGAREQVE